MKELDKMEKKFPRDILWRRVRAAYQVEDWHTLKVENVCQFGIPMHGRLLGATYKRNEW